MKMIRKKSSKVTLEELLDMLRPYYLSEIIVKRSVMDGQLKEEYYMPFEMKKKGFRYDYYEALYQKKRGYLIPSLLVIIKGRILLLKTLHFVLSPISNQEEQTRYKRGLMIIYEVFHTKQ